jgi:hypothetical protein
VIEVSFPHPVKAHRGEFKELDSERVLLSSVDTVQVNAFQSKRVVIDKVQQLHYSKHAAASYVCSRIGSLEADWLPVVSNLRALLVACEEWVNGEQHLVVLDVVGKVNSAILSWLVVTQQLYFANRKQLIFLVQQLCSLQGWLLVQTSKELLHKCHLWLFFRSLDHLSNEVWDNFGFQKVWHNIFILYYLVHFTCI